jgi:hypothetical protein
VLIQLLLDLLVHQVNKALQEEQDRKAISVPLALLVRKESPVHLDLLAQPLVFLVHQGRSGNQEQTEFQVQIIKF